MRGNNNNNNNNQTEQVIAYNWQLAELDILSCNRIHKSIIDINVFNNNNDNNNNHHTHHSYNYKNDNNNNESNNYENNNNNNANINNKNIFLRNRKQMIKRKELDFDNIDNNGDNGDIYYEYDVRLVTGRTHQIRLQFSAMNCPVIGDTKYARSSGLFYDENNNNNNKNEWFGADSLW